jgi:hypothetical protein
MALPEHQQPSSDARIAAWLGTFAALTVGALWIKGRKARASSPRQDRAADARSRP